MKIRCGKLRTSGTTLVDVVISVAIIAIMCAGMVGALTYGFFTMGLARENQRGTQLMLETGETIRLYNWDQVNSNGFIPNTFTGVYDPQAPAGQQGIIYYGTINIGTANVSGNPDINSRMRLMTITLTWTNRGLSHFRTNATLIGEDGIQNYVY